jgi:hypothetical protein
MEAQGNVKIKIHPLAHSFSPIKGRPFPEPVKPPEAANCTGHGEPSSLAAGTGVSVDPEISPETGRGVDSRPFNGLPRSSADAVRPEPGKEHGVLTAVRLLGE